MGMSARAMLTGEYNHDEFEVVEPVTDIIADTLYEEQGNKIPLPKQAILQFAE